MVVPRDHAAGHVTEVREAEEAVARQHDGADHRVLAPVVLEALRQRAVPQLGLFVETLLRREFAAEERDPRRREEGVDERRAVDREAEDGQRQHHRELARHPRRGRVAVVELVRCRHADLAQNWK